MGYDELRAVNNFIVGNPETGTKKLTEIIQRLNPGDLHICGNEGPMTHQEVTRSIELLGKEVIPAPHEIGLQPYG
jgi:alkanesulfonate monooxygenase SsuD/methylene tetrahydromethanopterin reductase-like flavin-dependent oxidoreductase (luciferase family)